MVRRSLWIGLRVGILAGIVLAVVKTVQARRAMREPLAPATAWRASDDPQTAEARDREGTRPARAVPTRPGPPRPSQPPMPPRPSVAASSTPPSAASPPTTASPPAPPEARPEPAARPEPDEKPAATKKAAAKKPAKRAAKKAEKAAKKAAKKAAADRSRAWVEPDDGACPQDHPVKAKLSSKIFHLPGMFAYDRTNADRCYADADAAVDDGFRAAKR